MIYSKEIKLLITDFDGTLVDTRRANYKAYKKALGETGLQLTPEMYCACFGLRLEEFMARLGINDVDEIKRIRERKCLYYPDYFRELRLNHSLLKFIRFFHRDGKPVTIATTAYRKNVMNILEYFGIAGEFDFIITGEDVKCGKPDPECYLNVMSYYGISGENTLIFEDSEVGIQAARDSGANYVVIDTADYGY